jgi:hypothetical protein
MTRWVSSLNDTAAGQRAVALVTLADLNFGSGTVYVNDGGTTLVYNSNTYLGVGQYGQVDAVMEDLQTTAKALQLTLSGVEPSLISSAMTEDYQGKVVTLYVGLLDVQTLALLVNPEWCGRGAWITCRSICRKVLRRSSSCEPPAAGTEGRALHRSGPTDRASWRYLLRSHLDDSPGHR